MWARFGRSLHVHLMILWCGDHDLRLLRPMLLLTNADDYVRAAFYLCSSPGHEGSKSIWRLGVRPDLSIRPGQTCLIYIYVFFLNNYILIPSHSDSFLFHFEYNFCQERVDLRQDTWWRAKTRTYSKVVNINPSYPQLLYHRLSKAPSFLDRKLTQRKRRSGTCIGLVAIFLLEVQNVLYRHMSSCVHYTHICVYIIYTHTITYIYINNYIMDYTRYCKSTCRWHCGNGAQLDSFYAALGGCFLGVWGIFRFETETQH
jgi:hypothetical protein